MRTMIFGSIIFLLALPAPARAYDQVPDYPVERWCDQVARAGGTRSEMIYGGCINQEQTAYDTLKTAWSIVPPATREWCDQVARAAGNGSYMLLRGCINQEITAGRNNAAHRFQR